jgi:hypothetical protein
MNEETRKRLPPPVCRGCHKYDRFRMGCKVDPAIKVFNSVPNKPCPYGRTVKREI